MTAIGWAIGAWADHGQWALGIGPLALATYLTWRHTRRTTARRAELAARPNTDIDDLELLLELPAIDNHHRNTRKETQ